MDEIDLIPSSYRDLICKLRTIKIFAYIFLVLISLSGIAYGALEYVKYEASKEIAELSELKAITSQQREELNQLKADKSKLEHQWALLNGLRSAVAAEDLFIVIDTAIKDVDVWFTAMKFQRAEYEVEKENVVNTGYFLIVTPDKDKQSLAIGTKLHITGEAPNHSMMSKFVNNLLDQPEILDVKVLETKINNNHKASSVNFNLAIMINLDEKVS